MLHSLYFTLSTFLVLPHTNYFPNSLHIRGDSKERSRKAGDDEGRH